ncbi:hypothetical protein B0H17DRAFT_1198223 [Mycena rosella]|uniref:Uncharacterized protein n=1 Tax=Mycena rosella TaxID=1033263 RepID=A0AAD7DPS5_MYCRO|nr:hypothetical protein B0H17DRAFT_1198223 [Mycena rosella]
MSKYYKSISPRFPQELIVADCNLTAKPQLKGLKHVPIHGILIQVNSPLSSAFDMIFVTRFVPFWRGLVSSNQLAALEMVLWLTLLQAVLDEEPSGVFTLGGMNASLFQGNIEFLPIAGLLTLSFRLLGGVSGVSLFPP